MLEGIILLFGLLDIITQTLAFSQLVPKFSAEPTGLQF